MQTAQEKAVQEFRPLILEWKKRYLEALIEVLQPKGNVLEVGFRSEHAANAIAKCKPETHTIIESNPKYLAAAKAWADSHSNITVIAEDWQTALPELGLFDSIFFNAYPEESDTDLLKYLSREEVNITSQKTQAMINMLEEEFDKINVQFSDKDVDLFFEQYGQQKSVEVAQFFDKLRQHGCITEAQFQRAVKKVHAVTEHSQAKELAQAPKPSLALICLRECLARHMRVGSRFSCVVHDTASLYADTFFFDEIICNSSLNFHETHLHITLPTTQVEIRLRPALIVLVEKVS